MSEAAVITLSNDASADAVNLQIRSRVRNAADAIAPVWPLKTFIACNPLQGFEGLPFEEAVKEGEALFGGRGYRPAHEYRKRYAKGEIAAAAVEAAIQRRLAGTPATFGFADKTLAAEDILFAHIAYERFAGIQFIVRPVLGVFLFPMEVIAGVFGGIFLALTWPFRLAWRKLRASRA
jgi:hypothetical protein